MLHVTVVGAGIAGLAAGISLRRVGHKVDIYERSSMNNEVGAAIHVPPNVTRFLIPWGLDPEKYRFVTSKQVTFFDAFTNQQKAKVCGEGHGARVGGLELYYAHRVDLHSALKWMATREEGPGTPVTIHLKSPVVGYNPQKPSVILAGGKEVVSDVVVGADGIHSLSAEAVIGRKNVPEVFGHTNTCFRFLISSDDLESDPETRWFNQGRDGWCRLHIDNDSCRRLVMYPCRDNTIHNFVGLYFDKNVTAESSEDWQAKVDKQLVLDTFHDFHPSLLKLVSKATEVTRWPLLTRHPLPTWVNGRLVLAGDSAHPMLPHQGQGGSQGLEDGFALGVALHGATTPEDIQKRLAVYQKIRRDRASTWQILSNVGQDQSELVKEQLLEYLPAENFPETPKAVRVLSFAYDIVKETLKAMREFDPHFQLPPDFFEADVIPVPENVLRNGINGYVSE